MSLENLAQYLQDKGLGTVGTDIFIGVNPGGNGILFRDTGAPVKEYAPSLHNLAFQMIVTSNSYPDGKAKADAVSAALTIKQATIGSAYFYRVAPSHEPLPFGHDTSTAVLFVVNFEGNWRNA